MLTSDIEALKSLRALRSLRSLRPLRMINRAPGLRVVVDALLAAIPSAINVMLCCILFYLIFAIFLVNYLKGKLRACGGAGDEDPVFDEVISADDRYNSFLEEPERWN